VIFALSTSRQQHFFLHNNERLISSWFGVEYSNQICCRYVELFPMLTMMHKFSQSCSSSESIHDALLFTSLNVLLYLKCSGQREGAIDDNFGLIGRIPTLWKFMFLHCANIRIACLCSTSVLFLKCDRSLLDWISIYCEW